MKKIITILALIACVVGLIYAGGGLKNIFHLESVKAFGDLTVNFHVPPGTSIFTLLNMKPGDTQSKPVDVTNGGTISHMVAVKGNKTGGIGSPNIENILTIVIKDGVTPVYGNGSATGTKTVQNFFTDSAGVNGIILGSINTSQHKTYTITVTFPLSAGNEYQGKSVTFDLTFGTSDIQSVVINEVFYRVDSKHGHNSEKDRDRERHEYDSHKNDKRYKDNNDDKYDRDDKSSQNDEWVELYNPTNQDISLKNWTLTDNSGQSVIIHANKTIKAKGFVVVAKDDDMVQFFKKPKIDVIETGHNFGDGLDDMGDHVILKNKNNVEVDRMSWGTDTSGFTPPAVNPVVSKGSSTERISAGFDTNKATDWKESSPPTPGK